jgi:hypothetical protein
LERVAGEVVGRETTSMRKVAFASFIGTAIEFYDFYIYGTAAALAGLWAFPLFWLIDTGDPFLIALSFSVGMVFFAMLYGPMGAFLSELYGTRLRYSGAAVSYNLGGVFGGAFAPLIAGQLLASTDGSWSISLYVLAMAIVSFVCIWLLSETHLTDLGAIRSEERRLIAEARESAVG